MRNASNHKGPWPKLSVWHGSADRTVNPANADEIVKQWLDVHQLPSAPMSEGIVDGHPRQVWWNADGERWSILHHHRHGSRYPARAGRKRGAIRHARRVHDRGGNLVLVYVAKFFGLTEWIHESGEVRTAKESPEKAAKSPHKKVGSPAVCAGAGDDAGSRQGAPAADDPQCAPSRRRSRGVAPSTSAA